MRRELVSIRDTGKLLSTGSSRVSTNLEMRNILICLAVSAAASISVYAESPAEIADRIVFARGGTARMQSIQTERMSGRIFAQDEMGSFVMELKRPNKVRLELNLGDTNIVKAYDGDTAWKLSSPSERTPQRMDDRETKELMGQADYDGPFLDYGNKGTQIQVLDKEMLGPSLVWKLKVALKEGRIEYYYVESTGYMVLMREEPAGKNGSLLSRQFYRNFQRVENIPFPFTVISEPGDSGEPVRLEFDKIEINIPEDDGRFNLKVVANTAK